MFFKKKKKITEVELESHILKYEVWLQVDAPQRFQN
jgi:hypothetical protein